MAKITRDTKSKVTEIIKDITIKQESKDLWDNVEQQLNQKANTLFWLFGLLAKGVQEGEPIDEDLQKMMLTMGKISEQHDKVLQTAGGFGFWSYNKDDLNSEIEKELPIQLARQRAQIELVKLPEEL